VKYSYKDTTIRVFCGITGTNRFHITVLNTGLSIHPTEITRCVERGWRGSDAKWTTGEGTGIGLWVVDNIMRAHEGNLLITPTSEGVTEVKLVFPVSGAVR